MNKKLVFILTLLLFCTSIKAQEKIPLKTNKGFSIEYSKTYDGNTDAAVIKNNFELEGINDKHRDVEIQITAHYDNPEPGINKTISVTFALTGSDKSYYELNEVDYSITGPEIAITIAPQIDYQGGSQKEYGAKIGEDIYFIISNSSDENDYDLKYSLDGEDVEIGTVIPLGTHDIICEFVAKNPVYESKKANPQTVTIVKKKLDIGLPSPYESDYEKEYDGTDLVDAPNPYYVISDIENNVVKGDDVQLESVLRYKKLVDEENNIWEFWNEIDVGLTIVMFNKLVGKDADKYELAEPALAEYKFEGIYGAIHAKYISIIPPSGTFTYGASRIGDDIKASISDENIEGNFTYLIKNPSGGYRELTKNEMLKAGDNQILIDYSCNDKHYIAAPLAKDPIIKVLPKTIDIEGNINLRTKIKDGTTKFNEYQIITPLPTLKGVLDGDKVQLAIDVDKTKYPSAEIGEYDIDVYLKLIGDDAANYKLSQPVGKTKATISSFEYTYNLQPVSLTPKTFKLVYNQSVLGKDLQITNTLKDNQSVNYVINGTLITKEALKPGTYNVSVMCYEKNALINREDIIVEVEKRTIEFAEDFKILSKYFDNSDIIYNGEIIIPPFSNLVEGDQVKVVIDYEKTSFPKSTVGEHFVNIVYSLTGKDADKYLISDKKIFEKGEIMELKLASNIKPNNNNIYQLVYATSQLGNDLKIDLKLTENEEVKYFIGEEDCTNKMLTAGEYKVTAVFYQYNTKVDECQLDIKVDKLKLQVSDPGVIHSKVYDGNNYAKFTGGVCDLINKLPIDADIQVDKQTYYYDTPDPGTNKTITVTITLKGDYSDRYIAPDPIIYTDGVITPGEIKITNLQLDKSDFCQTDKAELKFTIESGFPESAKIVFDNVAHQNGFNDFEINALTIIADKERSFIIEIPSNAEAGTYNGEFTLTDAVQTVSDKIPFTITVNYPNSFIVSKFTDVVLVNNFTEQFTEYQWFKDGGKIDGATMQFYCDPNGINGIYSVEVVTTDGAKAKICGVELTAHEQSVTKSLAKKVEVYPNPATSSQPINIHLVNLSESDIENANMVIVNSIGNKVMQQNHLSKEFEISLPKGSYTITIIFNQQKISTKVIVNN